MVTRERDGKATRTVRWRPEPIDGLLDLASGIRPRLFGDLRRSRERLVVIDENVREAVSADQPPDKTHAGVSTEADLSQSRRRLVVVDKTVMSLYGRVPGRTRRRGDVPQCKLRKVTPYVSTSARH